MLLNSLNRQIHALAIEFGSDFVPVKRALPPIKRSFSDYPEYLLPVLIGEYRELPFVYSITKNYFGDKRAYPVLNAQLEIRIENPNNKTLEISKESLASSFGKFFGKKDIEFEDHRFDSNFLIKSNDLDFTYKILTEPLRDQVVKNITVFSGKLTFGNIHHKSHGLQNRRVREKLSEQILDIDMIKDSPGKPERKIPKELVDIQSKLIHKSFGLIPLSHSDYRRTLSLMRLLFNIAENIKNYLNPS